MYLLLEFFLRLGPKFVFDLAKGGTSWLLPNFFLLQKSLHPTASILFNTKLRITKRQQFKMKLLETPESLSPVHIEFGWWIIEFGWWIMDFGYMPIRLENL